MEDFENSLSINSLLQERWQYHSPQAKAERTATEIKRRRRIAETGVEGGIELKQEAAEPEGFSLSGAATQVAGGALEFFQEAGKSYIEFNQTLHNLRNDKGWVGNFLRTVTPPQMGIIADMPIFSEGVIDTKKIDFADQIIPESDDMSLQLIRGLSQFATGMVATGGALRATGAAASIGKKAMPYVAGAVTDFMGFDPDEQTLAEIAQNYSYIGPLASVLASDEDDSVWEKRLKNSVEGLFVGKAVDKIGGLVVSQAKAYRSRRLAKQLDKEASFVAETQAKAKKLNADDAGKQTEELLDAPEAKAVKAPEEEIEITTTKQQLDEIDPTAHFKEELEIFDGINLKEMDPSDASRGVITNKELKNLAQHTGLSEDELARRQAGGIYNAEKMVAALNLMKKSATRVKELAKAATKKTASDLDKEAAHQAIDAHKIIVAQFRGASEELGRGLQAMKLYAKDDRHATKMMDEILNMRNVDAGSDAMFARLAQLDENQIATAIRGSFGKNMREAVFRTWINGLLANPVTHGLNLTSGGLAIVGKVGERATARAISMATGSGGVAPGEVGALMSGIFNGFSDAVRAAGKAMVKGEGSERFAKLEMKKSEPWGEMFNKVGTTGWALTVLGKFFESPGRMLMAGDEFLKGINYRMELESLATRRAYEELEQGALKIAKKEKLTGKAASKRVADIIAEGEGLQKRIREIIENPPDELQFKSVEEARVNTFTNPLKGDTAIGSFGASINKLTQKHPALRIAIPFIRTPANIIQYGVERSPLHVLPRSKFWKDVAKPGAKRDIAIAKVAFGTMVGGVAANLSQQGIITGGGPNNRFQKNLMMQSGWKPYSIKVGDSYIQYDRLAPWGKILGVAADIAEVAGELSSEDPAKLDEFVFGLGLRAGTLVNPEYLTDNLSQLFEVVKDKKNAERYVANMAQTLVPLSGALRGVRRAMDPNVREVVERSSEDDWKPLETVINSIKNIIPGLSEDNVPRLNMFGEEVMYPQGVGPDIASPILASKADESGVYDRLIELGMAGAILDSKPIFNGEHLRLRMPSRTISMGGGAKRIDMRLTNEQYNRYIYLSNGLNADGSRGSTKPLKEALADAMKRTYRNEIVEQTRYKDIIRRYYNNGTKLIKRDKEIRDQFKERNKLMRESLRRM